LGYELNNNKLSDIRKLQRYNDLYILSLLDKDFIAPDTFIDAFSNIDDIKRNYNKIKEFQGVEKCKHLSNLIYSYVMYLYDIEFDKNKLDICEFFVLFMKKGNIKHSNISLDKIKYILYYLYIDNISIHHILNIMEAYKTLYSLLEGTDVQIGSQYKISHTFRSNKCFVCT
jgi:hypothetical protein